MLNFQRLKYWLFTVSRGYSAPMSILNWLIIFSFALKQGGNALYGFLALIGLLFAHLGANLYDDVVDFLLKIPKQKCKTEYLENGFTNIKTVALVAAFYLGTTALIGLFFLIKCGLPVLFIALLAGGIILLYPKLNNFALGELAIGLTFGVLLFIGVYFVMLKTFSLNVILMSIPVSLLTIGLVYTHALMDYDFDLESGKRTFCIVLGSKENALKGLMAIYIVAFGFSFALIALRILPLFASLIIFAIPLVFKLHKLMKKYIAEKEHGENDFLTNFITSRNVSVVYNIVVIIAILVSK